MRDKPVFSHISCSATVLIIRWIIYRQQTSLGHWWIGYLSTGAVKFITTCLRSFDNFSYFHLWRSFWCCPGRLLNVLRTFNLRLMSTGTRSCEYNKSSYLRLCMGYSKETWTAAILITKESIRHSLTDDCYVTLIGSCDSGKSSYLEFQSGYSHQIWTASIDFGDEFKGPLRGDQNDITTWPRDLNLLSLYLISALVEAYRQQLWTVSDNSPKGYSSVNVNDVIVTCSLDCKKSSYLHLQRNSFIISVVKE